MRRRACEARIHGAPLSISSSNFRRVSYATGAGKIQQSKIELCGICDGRICGLHVRFAALVGTFVGGITSIATSWLGQQRQTKEQRRARQKDEVQALYKLFIQDASKLYVDALEHNTTEIANLVDVYATLNRMRVLSSPKVMAAADNALKILMPSRIRHSPGSDTRSSTAFPIRCAPLAKRATKS
jgi:hypothetical protein